MPPALTSRNLNKAPRWVIKLPKLITPPALNRSSKRNPRSMLYRARVEVSGGDGDVVEIVVEAGGEGGGEGEGEG